MSVRIPKKPIDQHRVDWWVVNIDAYQGRVVQHRHALYHENTPWKDVYPDDTRGADFVGNFQIFEDDRFTGRSDWGHLRDMLQDDGSFASQALAVADAIRRLDKYTSYLRRELKTHQAIRRELGRGFVRCADEVHG